MKNSNDLLSIDFVSPLPPVRSGIADYSADLLPHLARLCDLRVVGLSEQPIAPAISERWQPVGVDELGTGGRLPLFQMGNNIYHEQILELARRHAGVLVLHDIFLHHLLLEQTLARQQMAPYRAVLENDHGWIGREVAQIPRWGAYADAPLFSLPCHRGLLQSQRGILVHSAWARDLVLEEIEGIAGDSLEIRVIPMPMPLADLPAQADIDAQRREWAIPVSAPILGSFGFQTPIKRTDVAIRALGRPGMETVHLLVVGEVAEKLDLAAVAAAAGVAERVHLCGFVSREVLDVAMALADLCINLRYPTAGETSASLLRLFAQGRPAIVSDYAQFADLPAEVALKVELGDDEEDRLAARITEVLAAPEQLRRMGEAARELIRRRHAPEQAARAVAEACGELAPNEPPTATPASPPPPSTLTWGAIRGSMTIDGVAEPWPEGSLRRLRIELRNDGRGRWLAGHRGAGGVVLEIRLVAGDNDAFDNQPWPPLPVDLERGESATIEVELRRPLGDCTLHVEPHVLGHAGFSALGGPSFEQPV